MRRNYGENLGCFFSVLYEKSFLIFAFTNLFNHVPFQDGVLPIIDWAEQVLFNLICGWPHQPRFITHYNSRLKLLCLSLCL